MKSERLFKIKSFLGCESADAIIRILRAALKAVDPADAVMRYLARDLNLLRVNGQEYPLKDIDAVYLISVGKAGIPMADAASTVLGERLTAGIVVSKTICQKEKFRKPLEYITSSHPIPDDHSLSAGKKILAFLEKTTAGDLVIFLISGGGSALMTAPVDGVSLKDMEKLTSLLLGSGARIDEINILRRALDCVKGGGLAKKAFPAQIITLIISDVVNSPLEAIASGPTVPNPTNNKDALAVLEKYNLLKKVPQAIINTLEKEDILIESDFIYDGNTSIIGSNIISAKAVKLQAEREGFNAQIITTSLQGEAHKVGKELAQRLRSENTTPPFCLIFGGETTVTLNNAKGQGGRNQELALSAVPELAGTKNLMLITLATDGEDGPTDAAGAVVTGDSLARAEKLGLNVDAYLQEHNAYPFFDALGDLIKIGSTGTNVNDLTILFGF